MLINGLNVDCWLVILAELNDLDDLINCFKVCNEWSYLIFERTKNVKYLLKGALDASPDSVYYQGEDPIDGTLLNILFPNLLVFEWTQELTSKVIITDLVKFVINQESLRGIIYNKENLWELSKDCEMLAYISQHPNFSQSRPSLKQLAIRRSSLQRFTSENAEFCPNLERLQILNDLGEFDNIGVHFVPFSFKKNYDGSSMKKLKIAEFYITSNYLEDPFFSFSFLDRCPNLQSLYIAINGGNDPFFDESFINHALQDLVIVFGAFVDPIKWPELKRLLIKYPNLKHLKLGGRVNIRDEHIEQVLHILPNLVLLDVSECDGITRTAAYYVQSYCKRYGRSTKFYFNENAHEILSDWPELSTKIEKISQGFDFMKNCFLKRFHDLPYTLIPTDH